MEYKYFTIVPQALEKKRKTRDYLLVNNNSSAVLGCIKWYGAWRQYCFFPQGNTVWSMSCLEDIKSFIKTELKK